MGVVLLSGGLDSALNLAIAAKEKKAHLAITMRYGQKAESMECKSAAALSEFYGVVWKMVDVSWLGGMQGSSLTQKDSPLPQFKISELDNLDIAAASMKSVWVSNRNGIFLNIAAGFADSIDSKEVFTGFNKEEAATFPDNSVEYMQALNVSLSFSTLNHVTVESYTKNLDKSEIIMQALELNLPLNLVWSCYTAGPERCWSCESCRRTERALLNAGSYGKEWLQKLGANKG